MESTSGKPQFYLFNRFYLRMGTQLGRTHEFCRDGFLPALERHCPGPKIFLQALVAGHLPQVAMFAGLESWNSYGAMREKLGMDREFGRAFAAWEADAEPPLAHYTTSLLRAAAYSPPIEHVAENRIFELRVYHSPSHRQLFDLHARFSGREINIFHRLGIHPLFYTDIEIGSGRPALVYLTPFYNLAEREAKWKAFSEDPEWLEVKQDSAKQHGQIVDRIEITLFKAAPYSPIR